MVPISYKKYIFNHKRQKHINDGRISVLSWIVSASVVVHYSGAVHGPLKRHRQVGQDSRESGRVRDVDGGDLNTAVSGGGRYPPDWKENGRTGTWSECVV